ncbi:hypothetical protein ACFE04_029234 [Oxalis oulophora]
MNKGLVCNLNPLCKCGYHSVLLTSYTDEHFGKRFFSCGSNEVCLGKFCNFFLWLGDVDLNDWNRQLVTHLHLGCVELIYEKILLVNEDTGNNDAVQLVSNEVAVNQDDVICCKKDNNVFNAITAELAKLRNGVQEMINVINDKNGNTVGWFGYESR